MNVLIFIALIFVSTQAARKSDDDDWVHLPNKCEGRFVQFRIPGWLKPFLCGGELPPFCSVNILFSLLAFLPVVE